MPTEPKSPHPRDSSADASGPPAGLGQYRLYSSGGCFSVTVYPVGFVVEGDPAGPAGRRLDSRPASGGEVISRVNADGSWHLQRAGRLDLGRDDEVRAIKVLLQALREAGRAAELVEGAEDSCGEDGRVRLDGSIYVLQIVSVPADHHVWWKLRRTGRQSEVGGLDDAVTAVRDALDRKRGAAAGTILVLNAAHLGAVIGPHLVQAYVERFRDPSEEYRLREAWIVGPSARSTVRLVGASDSA